MRSMGFRLGFVSSTLDYPSFATLPSARVRRAPPLDHQGARGELGDALVPFGIFGT